MAISLALCPPADQAARIALLAGRSADEAGACRQEVADELAVLAEKLSQAVGWQPLAEDSPSLAQRLWACASYHWAQRAAEQPISFGELTAHLAGGAPDGAQGILWEVTLAVALEIRQPRAAELFEARYMPVVRSMARRIGGERAAETVDNFQAELIVPRENGPPRIAQYQGRTTLANWLRVVVANFCKSRFRGRKAADLAVAPEPQDASPAHCQLDGRLDRGPCEALLMPIFAQSVADLPSEDRLLIKMLLLDDVPQQELARCLGIHSGNVTRRRQRIGERVWGQLRAATNQHHERRRVEECLQLVIAGDDAELRQSLGALLLTEIVADGDRPLKA